LTTTSPDSRFVAAAGPDGYALYPVDGGEPRPIPGLGKDETPLRFTADGAALFVQEALSGTPTRVAIVRLDLATARKEPWLTFGVVDPNARSTALDITPDGRGYLYSYWRCVSDLYIVDGLR
jgi:hypothetical protein